jgi:predicted transposase/invertase (TIGR01784 family)
VKTDSIFYRLFQTLPDAFFELINHQSSQSNAYEFSSVELKQTAFRIDGLFLPVANALENPIYFLEVQFQKDSELYARFFSEIFLYLRLYAPTQAWRGVVVFARRSMEPTEIEPYRVLLESEQVTRLYLNELGDVGERSLGVGMIKLVVETKKRTPELVQQLVNKARSELTNEIRQQEVFNLIETIVLYKLPNVTRQELVKMFTRDDLRKTRYYQEVRAEAREELQEEVRQAVREELQQEVRQAVREELQQEIRQQEALGLVMRQLLRRFGDLNPQLQERMNQLSIEQLENLAEALLDFSNPADLSAWLNENITDA